MGARIVSGQEAAVIMQSMVAKAIVPHAKTVATIWGHGLIPTAIYEPSKDWKSVLKLNKIKMANVIGLRRDDPATNALFQYEAEQRWLNTLPTEDGPLHAFLIYRRSSLCLIFHRGQGWSIAPGTTDLEVSMGVTLQGSAILNHAHCSDHWN